MFASAPFPPICMKRTDGVSPLETIMFKKKRWAKRAGSLCTTTAPISSSTHIVTSFILQNKVDFLHWQFRSGFAGESWYAMYIYICVRLYISILIYVFMFLYIYIGGTLRIWPGDNKIYWLAMINKLHLYTWQYS